MPISHSQNQRYSLRRASLPIYRRHSSSVSPAALS
jgi:hypothetical protein